MEPRDGSAWASWCSPPSSPSSSDSVPSLVALGPARPRMLLAPPRGVLPSRSLCLGEIKTRRGEARCQTSRFTQHLPPKCPAPAPRQQAVPSMLPISSFFWHRQHTPHLAGIFSYTPWPSLPPPTLIPAGSSSSGKSWSFPSRSLGSAVLLPVLYLLLWCPIQAISPHLFHSICSSVLSPEISAPADVLCTLKNIQPPVKLFIPPRFCALGAACRPPGELTRAINQRDI